MARKKFWDSRSTEHIGAHSLVHVEFSDTDIDRTVASTAAIVPRHYASGSEIADLLRDLGKPKTAAFIEGKLPTSKTLRSGELGEILGTYFASDVLGYRMIARLRWKDSREMAMRGDDLLGLRDGGGDQFHYLKGEAKSRATLSTTTLNEAEAALLAHQGRPAAHTLSFLASRLRELGERDLSTRIHGATLARRIPIANVTHLLFTFSGNDPRRLLRRHTNRYSGKVVRLAVGVHTPQHQTFIKMVFEKVIRDARKR